MDALVALAGWLLDPARWQGADSIPVRLLEHVGLSAAGVTLGLAVALPVALAVGHTGRGEAVAINAGNLGRAIPSFALLLFFFPIFGLGPGTWVLPLVLLAIPPILTNTVVGLRGVDRDVVEAGRGMGMTELELLRRVELPVAVPVVLAGIRTAAVQVVATATLAALPAGGGLGRYIIDGFARQEYETRLLAGALLVALLAIATERGFGLLERALVSPGLVTAGRVTARVGPGPVTGVETPR